jgi:hypothetical protein
VLSLGLLAIQHHDWRHCLHYCDDGRHHLDWCVAHGPVVVDQVVLSTVLSGGDGVIYQRPCLLVRKHQGRCITNGRKKRKAIEVISALLEMWERTRSGAG